MKGLSLVATVLIAVCTATASGSPVKVQKRGVSQELHIIEFKDDPSSYACHGDIAGNGLYGWHLQRGMPVTITWEVDAAPPNSQLILAMQAGEIHHNLTESPLDATAGRFVYNVPSSMPAGYSPGPCNITANNSALTPVTDIFLVESITECIPFQNDEKPSWFIPVIALASGLLGALILSSGFWYHRQHRRTVSRRKGKRPCEGGIDLENMSSKSPKITNWMMTAVKRGRKNSHASSTPDTLVSTLSARNSTQSTHSRGSSSGNTVTMHMSDTDKRSKSSVEDTVENSNQPVRTYAGPPPRFTGAPSTWQPPADPGILCKAAFRHTPVESDEMNLPRGEWVIVDSFYEDGWVKVHVQDPAKYKFPKGKENSGNAKPQNERGKWPPQRTRKKTSETHANEIEAGVTEVDRTKAGIVPWACLSIATETEVKEHLKREALKSAAIAAAHGAPAGVYAFSRV
ncbi:hypothetical protein HDU85_002032 [Gaertneriomyces sp. JEL0708]|nr:hypothetical protein HDU85_002032 [Gaertneriomyces sp. JEL0708]